MSIRLALDWTPNTLHTPILVAASQGYYKDAGLEVTILSPESDSYAQTPAKKLLAGEVELAICPSDSVIAYATGKEGTDKNKKIQAIFALLDKDASTILCSSRSGIERPRDLDDKVYGSYNARYEDDIIRTMIRNDGGKGSVKIAQNTAKLDLFNVLTMPNQGKMEKGDDVSQSIDATWIFHPWEGLKAAKMGFEGVEFNMGDYGIPYGYSPVIARALHGPLNDKQVASFNEATRKAYMFVHDQHEETVKILQSWCKDESADFLSESLKDIQKYARPGDFGRMTDDKWTQFLAFLQNRELLHEELNLSELYINL